MMSWLSSLESSRIPYWTYVLDTISASIRLRSRDTLGAHGNSIDHRDKLSICPLCYPYVSAAEGGRSSVVYHLSVRRRIGLASSTSQLQHFRSNVHAHQKPSMIFKALLTLYRSTGLHTTLAVTRKCLHCADSRRKSRIYWPLVKLSTRNGSIGKYPLVEA